MRALLTAMNWKQYDPTWLVDLARTSRPDLEWLPSSLARCRHALQESRAYIYFVDPSDANKPGAAWQFVENVRLEHPDYGDVVLDILTDLRVGGIEFLNRL